MTAKRPADWIFGALLVLTLATVVGSACAPPPTDAILEGNAARGAQLFAESGGGGPACQSCHCPDASGGCGFSAPNIQGQPFALIDARTRDPGVSHPGGKFDFADQDVADIAAFLATYP
jgi:cytochrome c553